MRTILKNSFYWIALIILLCGATTDKNVLKVTYIGNCGFMYESNTNKVLIDPFGTQYGNFFYLPSKETQTMITEGAAPFDRIALLLITHVHGDHFNPFLAESFLLKNKKAKMVCPPQVSNQMKDSCRNFLQIETQIISPQIAMNESKIITVSGISVTVIRMQHGTMRSLDEVAYSDYTEYEKTEDFGFVVHLGKKNIFHQGDGCLKINGKALNKIDGTINIAHLSYFDWDSTSLNIVKNDLHATKVIFMHGTKPGKELQTEEFKKIESQLVFFKQELESKIFD
jgi:L-ascorbate metabolism protein UlaG (beta-lactamase superfamily)